jgi:hypothetical protein
MKTIDGLLKSYLPKVKPILSYVTSTFIVNGGDGSMVEFAVKKASGNNVKSCHAIPKDTSMIYVMEAINYDHYPKDIFLSLNYQYLPSRPSGYMDVSIVAINCDRWPQVFLCAVQPFKPR